MKFDTLTERGSVAVSRDWKVRLLPHQPTFKRSEMSKLSRALCFAGFVLVLVTFPPGPSPDWRSAAIFLSGVLLTFSLLPGRRTHFSDRSINAAARAMWEVWQEGDLCRDEHKGISWDTLVANAKLIAAAPALQEALEELLAAWPADSLPPHALCMKVANAINKSKL